MNTEEYTTYDKWLEADVRGFLISLQWYATFPRIARWFLRRRIEDMGAFYSTRCFVTRNPKHPLAVMVTDVYRAATGHTWPLYVIRGPLY